MAQQVDDLAGRHLLGIEQIVDAHVDEHLLVVRLKVFVVIDAGDRFLGSQFLGQHRRHDVVVLLVVHSDEEVAAPHRRLAQHGERRRVALHGNHVCQAPYLRQQFLIAVDDSDVVAVAAEHPRQMAAHLACTRYYDFHLRIVVFPFRVPHVRPHGTCRPFFSARRRILPARGCTERPMRAGGATFLQFILQMYTFVGESQNFSRKIPISCRPG